MSPNSSVYLGNYQAIICVPVYRRVPLGYGCKQPVQEISQAIIWVAANRCVPLGFGCKQPVKETQLCIAVGHWAYVGY